MRRLLLVIAIGSLIELSASAGHTSADAAQSMNRQRSVVPPSTTCVRHEPVGFFTSPEILGELGQVFAHCYSHPTCANPTDLETIQFDGYGNSAGWLWMGPSTTTFSVAQQDAIIADALNRAGAVPGKIIINLTFFRDVIVSAQTVYVLYFTATFARCPQAQKGMTWTHSSSNAQTGTITVGCSGCDPYQGDTPCTQSQPLLCIYKPAPAFPLPAGVNSADQYYQWSGGVVATTQPVAGNTFANSTAADSYCVTQFGAGWRIAEFHDGWGWNFQAYGGTVSAPSVPSIRFWVHINDQLANCW
jgi:hypothetical protein